MSIEWSQRIADAALAYDSSSPELGSYVRMQLAIAAYTASLPPSQGVTDEEAFEAWWLGRETLSIMTGRDKRVAREAFLAALAKREGK